MSGDPVPQLPSDALTGPQTPSRSSGGCGRSCLFGCLGGAGLTALLTVILLVFAWSEVQRKLPEWRERHPWLDTGIELAGLLRSPDLVAVVTGRQEGSDDPSLLPADIPVPSGALLETYSVGKDRLSAFQRLDRTPAEVLAHWNSRMPPLGWRREFEGELPDEEGRFQVWVKGVRSCRVEVSSRYGHTELWLRCSGRVAAQEQE